MRESDMGVVFFCRDMRRSSLAGGKIGGELFMM